MERRLITAKGLLEYELMMDFSTYNASVEDQNMDEGARQAYARDHRPTGRQRHNHPENLLFFGSGSLSNSLCIILFV